MNQINFKKFKYQFTKKILINNSLKILILIDRTIFYYIKVNFMKF
jgi:hypothetical protein